MSIFSVVRRATVLGFRIGVLGRIFRSRGIVFHLGWFVAGRGSPIGRIIAGVLAVLVVISRSVACWSIGRSGRPTSS